MQCVRTPCACTRGHAHGVLPVLWQVDTDELERVAVNIAQNAVVQTDNAEAVSRLNITASAIESDNMDPLGFGRIDTRVLALVSPRALAVFFGAC